MKCVLEPCVDKSGKLIRLSEKGILTIIRCSKIKQDKVGNTFKNNAVLEVHKECRRRYTLNPKPPSLAETAEDRRPARSTFALKKNCFLCARPCIDVTKCRNPFRQKYSEVKTVGLVERIREDATKRNDSWGEEVLLRISNVIDFVQSHGRYHHYCFQRFKSENSNKPGETSSRGGSTTDDERADAFEKLCDYLIENDECQYTLDELQDLYVKLNPGVETFVIRYLKEKLVRRFSPNLYITDIPGKKVVICFSGTASRILSDTWYQSRLVDEEADELRVVKAAAAIIRKQLKSKAYDCSQFPSVEQIQSGSEDLVPSLLKTVIYEIIKPTKETEGNKKNTERQTTAIAHSIISVARPRSFISPIQFGTAVFLHRRFGSRLLIELLANMGFCTSYNEVCKFERAVTSEDQLKINQGYVQYVFDNADYNVHTIDGHGTFHSMGGVLCVTPQQALNVTTCVPRRDVKVQEIENCGLMPLQMYKRPSISGYANITVLHFKSMECKPISAIKTHTLDMFLLTGNWLDDSQAKPGWSGCMEKLHAKFPYETSAVLALPFVNLSPSNPSTIHTVLLYAAKEGLKNGQTRVMVTFDQPLFAKAHEMVTSAPLDSPLKSLFIRLGGFHFLLSFLGSIGHIMAGSGLEELWNQVYAKNSIPQMTNGKAYSRAIRALFLTQEALVTVFLETLNLDINKDDLKLLYSTLMSGEVDFNDVIQCDAVQNFVRTVEEELQKSKSSGRTQKLWIQFIEMVNLVKMFIKSERTGDFYLHLHCVHQILPYFHATGHLNYAKSAHLYLQDCLQLLTTLPDSEFDKFISEGFFTIRRSDKFYSGVWTDMTIEQVLMRAMKTKGGLTGGRGITASTIATWVKSMPASSRIVEAIEKFASVDSSSSEQHIELRDSNQKRFAKHLQQFVSWLQQHNPFVKPPELSSLSTGILADSETNCDEAHAIGLTAIQRIEGLQFNEIKLKRKYTVKPLAAVTKSINVRNITTHVNPNQLLHRMVCTVRTEEQLQEIFGFELCTYPPSLFDESGMMRKGTKSAMVKVLSSGVPDSPGYGITNRILNVVDGGYLLHRVVWQRPATFSTICQQYCDYVLCHYGNATVVFDGYREEHNTKDEEHLRRSCSAICVDVKVENPIQVTFGQSEFLSNTNNKEQLITLLTAHLKAKGCEVLQAPGDADTLIVSSAIIAATQKELDVNVVGEDTDLLVTLVALAPPNCSLRMIVPGRGPQEDKIHIIQAIQQELNEMKDVLLCVYAFTGCDSVSSIYRKGKLTPFKKVKSDIELRKKLLIFNDPIARAKDIIDAGNEFFLSIYGSKKTQTLDALRHETYIKTVANQPVQGEFRLASLPPTTSAAREHSLRVYHQVQKWHGCMKDPLEWGWKMVNGHLRPITTSRPAAPESLLYLISCSCKEECTTNHCECRRSGLLCSSMCSICAGHGCSNSEMTVGYDEDADILLPFEEVDQELNNNMDSQSENDVQ